MKKIITIFTFCLIIFVFLFLYFLIKTNYINSDNELADVNTKTQMFNQDVYDKNLASSVLTADTDFFKETISKLNEDIKITSSVDALVNKKTVLYYTLPSTYLITDRDFRSQQTVISYNGFHSLYTELKSQKRYNIFLMSKILNAMQMTYQTGCYIYADLEKSDWGNNDIYKKAVAKYPNNKQLASQVFLLNLMNSESFEDSLYVGTEIGLTSRILDNFEKDLSEQEKAEYINNLKSMLSRFDQLKPTENFDSQSRKIVLPNIYQAYGYYVLSKFDKNITSDEVRQNFLEKEKVIYSVVKSNDDPVYINILWFQEIYLKFLFEDSSGKIDPSIISCIGKIVDSTNKLKRGELYGAGILFFTSNSQTDLGKWDNIRQNMIKVAEKDSVLKEYLKSYGLKID